LGKLPADLDTKAIIGKVNREDLWRTAAKNIGAAEADVPKTSSRGKETFFDGKVFDPATQGLSRLARDQEGGMMAASKASMTSVAAGVPVPGATAEIVSFRPAMRPAIVRLKEGALKVTGVCCRR